MIIKIYKIMNVIELISNTEVFSLVVNHAIYMDGVLGSEL